MGRVIEILYSKGWLCELEYLKGDDWELREVRKLSKQEIQHLSALGVLSDSFVPETQTDQQRSDEQARWEILEEYARQNSEYIRDHQRETHSRE